MILKIENHLNNQNIYIENCFDIKYTEVSKGYVFYKYFNKYCKGTSKAVEEFNTAICERYSDPFKISDILKNRENIKKNENKNEGEDCFSIYLLAFNEIIDCCNAINSTYLGETSYTNSDLLDFIDKCLQNSSEFTMGLARNQNILILEYYTFENNKKVKCENYFVDSKIYLLNDNGKTVDIISCK